MIPDLTIVVGYSCSVCNNCSVKRKDEFCFKCGVKINWSPYKNGKIPSVRKVKDEILNTDYKNLNPVYAGRAVYHNTLSLSIKKMATVRSKEFVSSILRGS